MSGGNRVRWRGPLMPSDIQHNRFLDWLEQLEARLAKIKSYNEASKAAKKANYEELKLDYSKALVDAAAELEGIEVKPKTMDELCPVPF